MGRRTPEKSKTEDDDAQREFKPAPTNQQESPDQQVPPDQQVLSDEQAQMAPEPEAGEEEKERQENPPSPLPEITSTAEN
jgi:hypothetical protein